MDPHTLLTGFVFAVSVIGYLAYQDWRDGKFTKGGGDTETNLYRRMGKLEMHFNHETTELLTSIDNRLESIGRNMSESFLKIHTKFDEYDKYGIKANCPGKPLQ